MIGDEMEYILTKKIKNPIIIQGFPSFGLVGTIATGFLIDHLNAEPIGEIVSKDIPPMLAVHNSQIIRPLELYYDKKNNILILNALMNVAGKEWELSEVILKMAKELSAKEIIVIEGVASPDLTQEEPGAYLYTTKKMDSMKACGIKKLDEGVILGVTASVLAKAKDTDVSCIFTETHSDLPDNLAAAKAIEVIDKYLGLKVDFKELIRKSKELQQKLQGIVQKGKQARALTDEKQKELDYMG
ncbi:MAG: PAC2 family protein [Candidatus Nanoarchaeia archaeon]|nr:PAC2 family protein [Candidatus Nanoarchaeia archaeon]MDD5588087.1 PAC2 family protein [Candidatus Nanoarchaeia archaeon]